MYALSKIRQVHTNRPVEKDAWHDTGSLHSSLRQQGLQVTYLYCFHYVVSYSIFVSLLFPIEISVIKTGAKSVLNFVLFLIKLN